MEARRVEKLVGMATLTMTTDRRVLLVGASHRCLYEGILADGRVKVVENLVQLISSGSLLF
eukprot:6040634-Amphidinium_carterae.1